MRRPELEQKIKKYRQQKAVKKSFQDCIQQQRKNLRQFETTSKDYYSKGLTNNNKIEQLQLNHRQYIEHTKQIMEVKNKLMQFTHDLQNIRTEIYFQERKLKDIKQDNIRYEERNQAFIANKLKGYEEEKSRKLTEYEERVGKSMAHVEQLLSEKQKQNYRKVQFIERKKKFEETKKKLKQNYEQELMKNKQKWVEEERKRRALWQKNKMEDMESRTLRNIEPEIQRIVQNSKRQIDKIRQSFESQIQSFTKIADNQYEQAIKEFNKSQSDQLQVQRRQIIHQNSVKLKQQTDLLMKEFQEERIRIKNQYDEQIKKLEDQRRRQNDEFLRKDKYFYMENLNEYRVIKEQYETSIRELDGVVSKEVEKKQQQLLENYRALVQKNKEENKDKLRKLIAEYDKEAQKKIAAQLQSLCNQIAIDNAEYERRISKETGNRIRQENQQFQLQMKQHRKTIAALQKKIQSLKSQKTVSKDQRSYYQTQYLQARSQNEFLNRKLLDLTTQIHQLKLDQSSVESNKEKRKEGIRQIWDKQILAIQGDLNAKKNQIKTLSAVMQQQQKKLYEQTNQIIKQIQINANRICQKKQQQAQRLKIKIVENSKIQQTLQNMIIKQMEYIKKYQAG